MVWMVSSLDFMVVNWGLFRSSLLTEKRMKNVLQACTTILCRYMARSGAYRALELHNVVKKSFRLVKNLRRICASEKYALRTSKTKQCLSEKKLCKIHTAIVGHFEVLPADATQITKGPNIRQQCTFLITVAQPHKDFTCVARLAF